MTKSALAEFAWLERRYLREIECGDKKPTVNAIYSICEALRVSPLEFFTMVEAEILRLSSRDKRGSTQLVGSAASSFQGKTKCPPMIA